MLLHLSPFRDKVILHVLDSGLGGGTGRKREFCLLHGKIVNFCRR